MQMPSFSSLLTLSIFILLCGCDKTTPASGGQKDRPASAQPSSTSGKETALGVTKPDSFKTAKVTEPASTQEQPSATGGEPSAEAPESSLPAGRPVTLQTPATRSAARVAAMQEFEALRASRSDKPEGKGR